MLDNIQFITTEIVAIIIGFSIRHFLMPIMSGKEISSLLKYLRTNQMTKDDIAELKYQLEQAKVWNEIHEKACPYVNYEIQKSKAIIKHLIKEDK